MEPNEKERRPKFNLDESPNPSSLMGRTSGSSSRRKMSKEKMRNSMVLLIVLLAAMAILIFSQIGKTPPPPEEPPVAEETVPGGAASNQVTGEMPASGDMTGAGTAGENTAPDMEPQTPPAMGGGVDAGVAHDTTTQQQMTGGAQAPDSAPSLPQAQPEVPPTAQAPQESAPVPDMPAPVVKPAPVAEKPAPEPAPEVAKAPAAPTKQETAPKVPEGPKNKLTNVKMTPGDGNVTVRISTDLPLKHYKYFTLEGPRVVVDLLGPFKAHATTMGVPANSLVKGVRIGNHPDKLRLVADIEGGTKVKVDVVRLSEKALEVKITGAP